MHTTRLFPYHGEFDGIWMVVDYDTSMLKRCLLHVTWVYLH